MERISPLAFKAIDFNGNTDIIPASQVMGRDYDVEKSDAWWISAWILEKKCITYTDKKKATFKDGKLCNVTITLHNAPKIDIPPFKNRKLGELKKC